MFQIPSGKLLFFTLLAILFVVSGVQAQAIVFVSALNGADGNPCTESAPCRNIAFALNLVAANGRVVIKDTGQYNDFSITKAVAVETAPGITALITNPTAPTLIAILANSTDKVVLRGLHLKGTGSNSFGIRINSGASVLVDQCTVEGMSQSGLLAVSSSLLTVSNSTFRANGNGVGLEITSTGTQSAVIENCVLERNTLNGLSIAPNSGANANVIVRKTRLLHNAGAGIRAIRGLENSSISCIAENIVTLGNGFGLLAERLDSVIRVSNSSIVGNAKGLHAVSLGNLLSRGNNTVESNDVNGSFTEAYTPF